VLLALRWPWLIATPGRGVGRHQEYEAQQTHQLLELLQRFDALVYDDDGMRARAAATHAGTSGAGVVGEEAAGEDAGGERRVVRMRPDRQVIRPLEVRLPHPPMLSYTILHGPPLPRPPLLPCPRWCSIAHLPPEHADITRHPPPPPPSQEQSAEWAAAFPHLRVRGRQVRLIAFALLPCCECCGACASTLQRERATMRMCMWRAAACRLAT